MSMDKDEFITALLSLLDLIELEKNWQLSNQRFDIMDEYGTVTDDGEASGQIH